MSEKLTCAICKNVCYCPIHVTDINKNETVSYDLCVHCGKQFTDIENIENIETIEKELNLENIKSQKELLDFIFGEEVIIGPVYKEPCPKCGLTVEEFDEHGRFGCSYCYEHFHEAMEHIIYPYHESNKHTGKVPKNFVPLENLIDELKTLKLKKARALEYENYNEAAQFRREIEQLQIKINNKKS